MSKIYYVYEHIRLDTGQTFYVGKGTNRRAWAKTDRNAHWLNIVNYLKNNNLTYDIKIISYFDNESDAYQFEIETIKKLKHLNNLANYTDGGDAPPVYCGDKNPMRNKEIAAKSGLSRRGIAKSEECKNKISKSRKGKAIGDANAMRRPEIRKMFTGINNPMARADVIVKHFKNVPRGKKNGMYGRTGDKNPMFGKPSAMRNKKNLGIAWAAANKTWQKYWGA